jgi:Mrp family chromosome partitioning ATPase
MSKNFELLSRAGWRQEYFEGLPTFSGTNLLLEGDDRRESSSKRRHPAAKDDPVFTLVRKVFFERPGPQSRMVAFSGATRHTGCSSACIQAAKSLASCVDGKVCIVDVNFEAPFLHQHFSGGELRGISDAISEPKPSKCSAAQVGDTNLWFLPAGNQCKHVLLLPDSSLVETRLRELRKEFDYVLLDGPALTSSALATSICKAADGTVMVMEPSGITATTLANRRRLLATAKIRLLGVVINQKVPTLPSVLDRLSR